MECYCYILECADGTFYTGWTTDPARREKQHNHGHGARYTRTRRPVRLVYVEAQPDRANAMRRERALKALKRKQKQKLILCCPGSQPPDPGQPSAGPGTPPPDETQKGRENVKE